MNLLRLCASTLRTEVVPALDDMIKTGATQAYTEELLSYLMETQGLLLAAVRCDDLRWYEIDDAEDLRTAERIFARADTSDPPPWGVTFTTIGRFDAAPLHNLRSCLWRRPRNDAKTRADGGRNQRVRLLPQQNASGSSGARRVKHNPQAMVVAKQLFRPQPLTAGMGWYLDLKRGR